jgi:NADH:ubiquinone oxidoreductase subunit 2 (subunit N)
MFASIFILLIILSNQYKIKNYNLFSAQTKVLKFIVYCSLFLILITFPLILNSSGFQSDDVFPYYQINLFTQSIKFIMLIINIVIINFLPFLLKQSNMPEFPLLFQMLNSLSFIVISTSNLALLLLALEAFSLILYILTTFEHSHGGVTAAVKYFSFGTLGSILLF